jgi:hypothetical protein
LAINKNIERLFRILNSHSSVKFSDSEFTVKFGNRDWRKYVPKEVRQNWKELSTETKHAIFILAEMQARTEKQHEAKVIDKRNYLTQEQKDRIDRILLRLRKSQKE